MSRASDMNEAQRALLDTEAHKLTQRLRRWGPTRWRLCTAADDAVWLAVYSSNENRWQARLLDLQSFQKTGSGLTYKTENELRGNFARVQHPEELEPTFALRLQGWVGRRLR